MADFLFMTPALQAAYLQFEYICKESDWDSRCQKFCSMKDIMGSVSTTRKKEAWFIRGISELDESCDTQALSMFLSGPWGLSSK